MYQAASPTARPDHPRGIRALRSPRWIVTTLLVIAAVTGMARLGFWQLDRLEQRRAENRATAAQISAPALDLNAAPPADLAAMEYRAAAVTGVYDPAGEVLLRNQVYENQPGYYLLTPLRIAGREEAVLVNRGFVPLEAKDPAARQQYLQTGALTVSGVLRAGHVPRVFGAADPTLTPGSQRLEVWNAANLPRIAEQLPYPLLPMLLELAPGGAAGEPGAYPMPVASVPDLSEGSHLSYAFQWFTFAALLALGYPYFLKKQLFDEPRPRTRPQPSARHSNPRQSPDANRIDGQKRNG